VVKTIVDWFRSERQCGGIFSEWSAILYFGVWPIVMVVLAIYGLVFADA